MFKKKGKNVSADNPDIGNQDEFMMNIAGLENGDPNINLNIAGMDNSNVKNTTQNFTRDDSELNFLLDGSLSDSGISQKEYRNTFVSVGSEGMQNDEFEIIENNNPLWKIILGLFRAVIIIAVLIALISVGLFSMLYRVVPGDIVGSSYKIKGYSIISKDYRPNLDKLKKGDIIYVNKGSDHFPLVYDFDKYTYDSRSGIVVYGINEKGDKKVKIQSVEIDYISNASDDETNNSDQESNTQEIESNNEPEEVPEDIEQSEQTDNSNNN